MPPGSSYASFGDFQGNRQTAALLPPQLPQGVFLDIQRANLRRALVVRYDLRKLHRIFSGPLTFELNLHSLPPRLTSANF